MFRYLKKLFSKESPEQKRLRFQKTLIESMRELQLSERDIANRFSTSLPTVRRWINGSASPHEILHKLVYKEFDKIRQERKDK